MPENFKELYEKVTDIFWNISKKFDGISEKLYQQTGKKINVGVIVLCGILLIITAFFVKGILSFILGFLMG